MRDFLDTLKKGVELYIEIINGDMFKYNYSVYYSDCDQLFPTDNTYSNMLPDDFVLDFDEPVAQYLEIICIHEDTVKLKQSSFQNSEVSNTTIDYLGRRFITNDTINDQKIPVAIYAALMDFFLINDPSVYDMPFVIDLFINSVLWCYHDEERIRINALLKDALVSDMATIESTLTFTNCYAMELDEIDLNDECYKLKIG